MTFFAMAAWRDLMEVYNLKKMLVPFEPDLSWMSLEDKMCHTIRKPTVYTIFYQIF